MTLIIVTTLIMIGTLAYTGYVTKGDASNNESLAFASVIIMCIWAASIGLHIGRITTLCN